MKRILVLAVLPLMLFALEKVNLIKDAGFERNSDEWIMRSEAGDKYDSTILNRHDPDKHCSGQFCSSIDETIQPIQGLTTMFDVKGCFTQVLKNPKKLEDLDSLKFMHNILFKEGKTKHQSWSYGVALFFTRPKGSFLVSVVYDWAAPDLGHVPDDSVNKYFPDTIFDVGIWHPFSRNLIVDLLTSERLDSGFVLDSFQLYAWGVYIPYEWRGEKAFFDNISLTGYSDYDVGVKELLSPDSIGSSEALGESLRNSPAAGYIPIARIKNFGRKPADTFLVVATIEGGSDVVYADTLSWSLTADTEDTLSFKEFKPSDASNYTLTVSTIMVGPGAIDESDEDDAVSRTLFGTAVAEPVLSTQSLSLQIEGVLRVRYSLPLGEQGTISLYDPAGRRVEFLTVTGSGEVRFEAGLSPGLATGVYFVRLETEHSTLTKKAVLLR